MNNSALEDERLGFRAKGILAYLLSKPDGWRANLKDLQRRSTDGRDAIRAAISQLKKAGYAHVQTIRDKRTGRMDGKELVIRELPNNGFSDLRRNRTSENPTYSNKESSNKETIAGPKRTSLCVPSLDVLGTNGHEVVILEYSPAVELFARFAKKQEFHVLQKDQRTKEVRYVNGGKDGGWSRATLTDWQKYYDALAETVKPERIERLVKWYVANHTYRFLPVCHTFPTFCNKFKKIELVRRRKLEDEGEEDTSTTSSVRVTILPDSRKVKRK
jgi:hypothetical protein